MRRRRGEIFLCDSNTRAFCAEGAEIFFFKNSIPKRRKILYVKLHFSLLNFQFFGFGQNFRKMAARNLTLGARAAVYRGGAVLSGVEEGRRMEGGGEGEGGSKIEI